MSEYSVYTQLIVEEARRRGIAVEGHPEMNGHYVRLSHGDHVEHFYQAMTDHYGQASHRMIFHKELAAELMRRAGFPVPDSIRTDDIEVAMEFMKQHGAVVTKPVGRSGGAGIRVNLRTREQLVDALDLAKRETVGPEKLVTVQEHIEGEDVRVLVVNNKDIFASRRIPAHVVGDGTSTIAQLVSAWNEQVIEMRQIALNEMTEAVLAEQGMKATDVPQKDQRVYTSWLANAHRGAIIEDVTDIIHDDVRTLALNIAEHFACPFVGIDLMSPDITQSTGKVIELNPHAGIVLHHHPTIGKPRNVAGAILDMAFPEVKS